MVWSPVGEGSQGVIAGGLENGHLNVWNVNGLLSKAPIESSRILNSETHHKGPVKGLEFNSAMNVLASAATDGDIFIWDLNNLSKPYTPGNKSSRLEDVTSLAWNKQVPHIMATGSNNGMTVVWDLKNRREVLQLSNPNGRKVVTSIAWNPDNATQILTATDDDQNPGIMAWDLRNAHAPERVLFGHTKGIMSMAWCPRDSDMLFSCAKDNRTILWNPHYGQIIGEFAPSRNWSFDVQWSPKNPELVAIASFDSVKVCGLSMANLRIAESSDPFAQPTYQTTNYHQAPKWLKRPLAASFAFGGNLVSFSGRTVQIRKVVVFPELVQRSNHLTKTLRESSFIDFCEYCLSSLPKDSQERYVWSVLKIMFSQDPRQRLLEYLGFSVESIMAKVNAIQLTSPTKDISDDFSDMLKVSDPFSILKDNATEEEELITRSVLLGDFASAVKVCLACEKMTDALLIALLGGPELLAKVQEHYLATTKTPYLRLVNAILSGKLEDVVKNADILEWKEIVAFLCTFSKTEDFSQHLSILGTRLLSASSDRLPSTICFLAGGNIESLTKLFTSKLDQPTKPSQLWSYGLNVAQILETLVVFRLSMNGSFDSNVPPTPSPAIMDLIPVIPQLTSLYSQMLIEQGEYELATIVLNGAECKPSENDPIAVLKDRLYNLHNYGWSEIPAFPFSQWMEPTEPVNAASFYDQSNAFTQSNGYGYGANNLSGNFSTPQQQQNNAYSYGSNPYGNQYAAPAQYPAQPTSQPPSQYSTLPASQFSAQPTSQYSAQPTGQYPAQPTSQYSAQPTSQYSAPYGNAPSSQAPTQYGQVSPPQSGYGQAPPVQPSTTFAANQQTYGQPVTQPSYAQPTIPQPTPFAKTPASNPTPAQSGNWQYSQPPVAAAQSNTSQYGAYPPNQFANPVQEVAPAKPLIPSPTPLIIGKDQAHNPASFGAFYGNAGYAPAAASVNYQAQPPVASYGNSSAYSAAAPSNMNYPNQGSSVNQVYPNQGSNVIQGSKYSPTSPTIPPATEAIHSSGSASNSSLPAANQKIGGYNDPPMMSMPRTSSIGSKAALAPISSPFSGASNASIDRKMPSNQPVAAMPEPPKVQKHRMNYLTFSSW